MKTIVAGSLNIDFVIPIDRFPGPGETVLGGNLSFTPGGKGANQAVAAAKLGMHTLMAGAIGNDAYGKQVRESLESSGVDTTLLVTQAATTGVALIHLTSDGENRIIVCPGANEYFEVSEQLRAQLATADALMLQLEIPIDRVAKLIDFANEHHVPVFLDPSPVHEAAVALLSKVDWVMPNEHEIEWMTGQSVQDVKTARIAIAKLLQLGAKRVVLKMGPLGAMVGDESGFQHVPGFQVNAVDTTAAGDGFGAGFVTEWVQTGDVHRALRYGNAVGALVTTKVGAQVSLPSREAVSALLQDPSPT